MGSAEQIAPGLRRWTSWHEEWKQEVGSLAVQTPDGLVLIDPIDPPPEVRRPDHVLITVFWHGRSTPDLGAKHVWAHPRGVRRLKNRGTVVTDPLGPEYDRGGVGTALGLARDPVLQSRHACDTEADARAITVPICENSSADAGTS